MAFKVLTMSLADVKLVVANFIAFCSALSPLVLLILSLTFIILYDFYRKRGLPPGPPGLPLIGNYLSLPKSKSWLMFTSLSKKYGGIYTFHSGLTPRIIITDPQIAFELFTGRGNKYSSRPPVIVFETFTRGSSIITREYGPEWQKRRKVFHQFLNHSAIQPYKEREQAEASRLIHQISQDEGRHWKQAIERFTASTIFSLSYGRRIDSLDSKVLKQKLSLIGYGAGLMVPGRYLVESVPILNYLPAFIARWKIQVNKMAGISKAFDVSLINIVREDMKKAQLEGSKRSGSLTENMILAAKAGDKDIQSLELDEGHFAGMPSALFGAGSITTITFFKDAVLALMLHPWVFLAAQKEIDEVVGVSRSPTFADRENMPYIDALVKETLRWKSVLPNGLAHATSEDDVYEGYRIPKGTSVTFNTWGLHQDPSYFPSPEDFAPERYLPETDERFREELKGEKTFPGKYGHAGFGWGRRVCSGADLATNNLWIALAKLIWAFDLMPVEGEKYEELEFDGTVLAGVRDFRCRWRLRGEEYGHTMEREVKVAEDVLDKFPPFE